MDPKSAESERMELCASVGTDEVHVTACPRQEDRCQGLTTERLFLLLIGLRRQEAGGRLGRLVLAVLVHLGLGGVGGTARFPAAGGCGKRDKQGKNGDQATSHAVKLGVSGALKA